MLLGVLSIIQVVFLPGYLVVEAARIRTGSWIERAVIIFGLSLLINYLCVFLLAALGIYSRRSLAALIALEVVLLAVLVVRRRSWRDMGDLDLRVRTPQPARWMPMIVIGASMLALVVAAVMSLVAIFRFNVFNAADALFSWNAWAYTWTSGAIPKWTQVYPQLIPANWSVMYVLTANRELQLFPLSIMPLFGIAILAMFVDLGLRRKRLEYFLALLLVLWWVFIGLFPSITFAQYDSAFNGYVDVPVAFMALAALYLLELRDDRRPADWGELALPLILACGAAVTKMNGFYVVAVVLVAALIGHVARRPRLPAREWLKSGVLALSVLVIVPGTWYGMKIADFISRRDLSHAVSIASAADAAAGSSSATAHMLHAMSLLPPPFIVVGYQIVPGYLVTAGVLALAVVLAVLVPRARWVGLAILLPYTLLWAAFLSYDTRNLMMMLPVAAYVIAFAIGGLCERLARFDLQLTVSDSRHCVPQSVAFGLLVGALVGLIALSVYYPAPKMTVISLLRQRQIGNAGVNAMLYGALSEGTPVAGRILTDYPHLMALPGFRNDPLRLESSSDITVHYVDHFSITPKDLGGISYLVISDLIPPDISDALNRHLADGSYSLIAQVHIDRFMQWGDPTTVRLIRVNAPAGTPQIEAQPQVGRPFRLMAPRRD